MAFFLQGNVEMLRKLLQFAGTHSHGKKGGGGEFFEGEVASDEPKGTRILKSKSIASRGGVPAKECLQYDDVINARDKNGVTPLMRACSLASQIKASRSAKVLADMGANVSVTDK